MSFPTIVTGFPNDVSRSRAAELLDNILKESSSSAHFSAAEIEEIRFAIACLRSDAAHAEDEAEISNTPLWWSRLLTQPLPYNPPVWLHPCSCLGLKPLPLLEATGSTDTAAALSYPLLICPHTLRLHKTPTPPFLSRPLPGAAPSETAESQHPFDAPKAVAAAAAPFNAASPTGRLQYVEVFQKLSSFFSMEAGIFLHVHFPLAPSHFFPSVR
jgi:hypothetical protein